MNARDNDPLHEPINAKLAEVVAGLSSPPAWFDGWTGLGPDSTEEARLAVYQAVRDSGLLPEDAGFFLVAWQVDSMVSCDIEGALRQLDDPLADINQLEAERALGRVFAGMLKECGADDIARLHQTDRQEYERTYEVGRQFFFGPDNPASQEDPKWLQSLVDVVISNMRADARMEEPGLWFRQYAGSWWVSIFPTCAAAVREEADSVSVPMRFAVNLEGLRAAFDEIVDSGWNAVGSDEEEGPYTWIEGIFDAHEVFLQLLTLEPYRQGGTSQHSLTLS